MLLTHLVLFSFLGGASASDAAVIAETSGGWRPRPLSRRPGHWPREESDEAREARIKAERIRMGILPPDPAYIESYSDEAASSINSDTTASGGSQRTLGSTYSLFVHLLPEDLAGLEALAARAAQLTVDHEIAMWLRLAQERRLHEAWLRDEDDAAVLMLAIATVH